MNNKIKMKKRKKILYKIRQKKYKKLSQKILKMMIK